MEIRQLSQDLLEGYTYRGEGNSNLVISLPKARSVLRFRKIKSTEELPKDGGRARVEFEYKFFQEVTAKYLGKFVNQPEIVYCNCQRDIENWNERIEIYRPEYRRDNIGFQEYGIILPDYTQLPLNFEGKTMKDMTKPTFCVEIKPKQGFVPEADRLFQRCPYCINQFYKVSKGTFKHRSNYCPCDLFSGDRSRVKRAIKSLVESPQNNLMVFKNGVRAWSKEENKCMNLEQLLVEWFSNDTQDSSHDAEQLIEDLSYLVSEALLREFPVSTDDSTLSNPIKESQVVVPVQLEEQHRRLDLATVHKANANLKLLNETCNFSNGNLPQGSVLGRIFFMQQLHCINTDIVYAIYSTYSPILDEQMVYFPIPNGIKSPSSQYKQNNVPDLRFEETTILRNYLLFSIARDCSLLITFREINFDCIDNISRNHVIMLSQQRRCFSFNIGITDVDPKNLNRIEKHRQHTIRALNSITVD